MTKIRTSICCFLITILLSGCWDTINIEDRGFVIGVAIDQPTGNSLDQEEEFLITNQIVVPSQMAGQEAGGDREAFYNLSRKGDSVYKTTEEFAGSSSKVPYYEHLMLILLSKEIAEKEHTLAKVLDGFIRSPHTRRNIKVIITEDRAIDMLDFETPDEPLPAMHLQKMLEQSNKQAGFYPAKSLGDIEEMSLVNGSFALPLLTKKEDYVDYHSVAVYQGEMKKIVGIFDKSEKTGLDFIQNDAEAHILSFDYEDEPMSFRVLKQKNQFKIETTDVNAIKVMLDIKLEGGIRESYAQVNFENEATLKAIEKAASERVEHLVDKTFEKSQKEFNADIFKVWRILETRHNQVWKKVRDDWEKGENYFSDVSFEVNVDIELDSTGTSNKTI